MFYIHNKPPWRNLKPTEESIYWDRRKILKSLGLVAGGIVATPGFLTACMRGDGKDKNGADLLQEDNNFTFDGIDKFFPAPRNEKYTLDREITDEYFATHHNNFYEFIEKSDPSIYNGYKYVDKFDFVSTGISYGIN